MFRDRTNLYISYRRTFPHHKASFNTPTLDSDSRFNNLGEEEQGLINRKPYSDEPVEGESVEMRQLPPSIVDLQHNSEMMLADIEVKINELARLYKKNLLPGFSDTTEDDAKISELTFKITKNFQLMYTEIKALDDSRLRFGKRAEVSMIDNLKKSLALRTQELSTHFRKLQNSYIRYLKEDEFEVPLSDAGRSAGGENGASLEEAESSEKIESYSRKAMQESSQQLQLQQQQQETISDEYLEQREREIYKIAQGVVEISTIFKELETLVIDQGTVLDRIDYNLNKTVTDVKNADKQMKKAESYQKSTAKCKIVLFLVLLILLLVMWLLLKPRRRDVYYHEPAKPGAAPTAGATATATATATTTSPTTPTTTTPPTADSTDYSDLINEIGL